MAKIQTVPDVVPGSIWNGSNYEKFVVKSLVAKNGDIWVHYELMGTKQEYSCLVEAFQQRFTPFVNHRYMFYN